MDATTDLSTQLSKAQKQLLYLTAAAANCS